MKLPGNLVVIVCCLFFQMSNIIHKRYLAFAFETTSRTLILNGQGVLFLIYPLLGHLADACLTRYRALKLGLTLLIAGELLTFFYTLADILAYTLWKSEFFEHGPITTFYVIVGILCATGCGFFQANVIQFGLDQLLEAPTTKLISFIYLYYWTQSVCELISYYSLIGVHTLAVNGLCNHSEHNRGIADRALYAVCYIVMTIITTMSFLLLCASKNNFYIQRAGVNPFRNIFKVLKYTWKHKVPENRSAFTYWEEDIPPRIDLGKHKYGGPFTNEEVEDTKTFLRILPLLLCLFGYHVAGDGYSAPGQLQRTSCPSLPVLLLVTFNPQHVSALMAVIGIPLYWLIVMKICPSKKIRLLTRIWIGLYLALIETVVYIIIVMLHNSNYWEQFHSHLHDYNRRTETHNCFVIRTGGRDNPCEPYDDPVDNIYLWLIIPQLISGLSSLFVYMTVLEFICAQAPHTVQGLLIGLWYATFGLKYLIVANIDTYVKQRQPWLISEGVKGFLILLSLAMFSFMSSYYRHRERDEIVNVQGMIEEIYERRLAYEREYLAAKQERNPLLHAHDLSN